MLALSEIQTTLAGGIGQGFDPAVKEISAPIEDDPLNPCRLCPLGNELTDGIRSRYVGAILKDRPEAAIEARSRRERASGGIIDDLHIDMLGRAEHRKTWPIVRRAA